MLREYRSYGNPSTRNVIRIGILGLFDLFGEALSNPSWIAPLIDDRPNNHVLEVVRVVNSEWEDLADQPVIIFENDPVRTTRDPEALNV